MSVCPSLEDRTAPAPVCPPARSSVFGNGIPWSEVQIQLQQSVHKLDFLSCATDRISGVSFTGASLAHSDFNYHYIRFPVSCHVPEWAVTRSVGSGVHCPLVNSELWLSSASVSFEPPAVHFIPFLKCRKGTCWKHYSSCAGPLSLEVCVMCLLKAFPNHREINCARSDFCSCFLFLNVQSNSKQFIFYPATSALKVICSFSF